MPAAGRRRTVDDSRAKAVKYGVKGFAVQEEYQCI